MMAMDEICISVNRLHIDETTTALLERIGVGLGHGDIVCIFPLYCPAHYLWLITKKSCREACRA